MKRNLKPQDQMYPLSKVDEWAQSHGITRVMTSHVWLAFFYGIFLFLYEIAFMREMIPVVHPILIAWAGALILYDLVVRRYWNRFPYWKILAVYGGVCFLGVLMNREAGVVSNLKSYIMIMLPLGAFYPLCLMEKKEARNRAFLRALLGGALVIFVASSVALVLYLVRFSRVITYNGISHVIGYRYYIPDDPTSGMLLYGIYMDTNHASIYALIFAAYSLFGILECRKGLFGKRWQNTLGTVLFVCNFVVQILYFPLANSRGGWLSLILVLTAVLFLFFYGKRLTNRKPVMRFAVAILLAVVCTFAACNIIVIGRTGVSYASVTMHDPSIDIGNPDETDPGSLLPGIEDNDDFTKKDSFMGSGRIGIWKNAMELYSHSPIWGIGPNHRYYAEKYNMRGTPMWKGTAVHNSYLDLLLDYGVLAFATMIVYCLLCFAKVWKKAWGDGKNLNSCYYIVSFMTLLIAFASLFLSCIFINTTAMYFLMLISMGYLAAGCKRAAETAE